jgi:Ca2+/H+ antiporter, TMEM165/GDT1 family
MAYAFVGVGLAIFGLVFAIELVSRTNVATILMATRHPFLLVWYGAAVGFAGMTLVSVILGTVLVALLLPYLLWVKIGAGVVIAGAGVFEISRPQSHDSGEKEETVDSRDGRTPLQVVAGAASLIAVLEIGDDTQILAIGFVAATSQPILVYVAVTLGLVSAAAVGARLGHFLKDRVQPARLRRLAGVALMGVGLGIVLFALDPGLIPAFLG